MDLPDVLEVYFERNIWVHLAQVWFQGLNSAWDILVSFQTPWKHASGKLQEILKIVDRAAFFTTFHFSLMK